MSWLTSLFVALIIGLASCLPPPLPENPRPVSDISNLCPDLFSYERTAEEKPGLWSGRLTVESKEELSGVWIRLFFDGPVEEVQVEKNFETKLEDDKKNEVLIKNRHYLLQAFEPLTLKITVKYQGSDSPNVIRYKLNARTVCPYKQPKASDFYQGDDDSPNFLQSLVQFNKSPEPNNECGVKSSSNSYPWHASLFLNDEFLCEATLIGRSHLLTSAHCVTSKHETIPVPAGFLTAYLGANGAAKGAIRANVTEVVVHPGYQLKTLYDDLAIVKISPEINNVNDQVVPVCLGSGGSDESVIVGFENKDRKGDGKVVEVKVRRVEDGKCPEGLQGVLADGTFCAAYLQDNENCAGNSGSAFISTDGNKATLKGIVSLGLKLQEKDECKQDTVAIVTDASRYLKWLRRYLAL